jgi:hypothetical protein
VKYIKRAYYSHEEDCWWDTYDDPNSISTLWCRVVVVQDEQHLQVYNDYENNNDMHRVRQYVCLNPLLENGYMETFFKKQISNLKNCLNQFMLTDIVPDIVAFF